MIIGRNRIPYRCFLKLFIAVSHREPIVRLGRVVWARNGGPGTERGGWAAKLSLALRPALFRWVRENDGWLLVLCGLRIHYRRSYGGWIV